MTVKTFNDSAVPDGLTPTLLGFNAYLLLTNYCHPSPELRHGAAAIYKAAQEIQRLHASQNFAAALHKRNGPDTLPTLNLPLLSKVHIWREKQDWQGSYRLLSIAGESYILQLHQGSRKLRSIAVKPYYEISEDPPTASNHLPEPQSDTSLSMTQEACSEIASPKDIAQNDSSKPNNYVVSPARLSSRQRKIQVAQLKNQYHAWPEVELCTLFVSTREQYYGSSHDSP